MSNDVAGGAIVALMVVLVVANLGALLLIAFLQVRVNRRDQEVTQAHADVALLKQEAHNVAMAKMLLDIERSAGAGVQASMEQAIERFTQELRAPLQAIAQQMEKNIAAVSQQQVQSFNALQTDTLKKMETTSEEFLTQYRNALRTLAEATVEPVNEVKDIAEQQRAQLRAQFESEMKRQEAVVAQRQKELMTQFEDKLSDLVASYLTETLGNDIDLGAQAPYLFRMLEEHKAELKRELIDGAA